jgi:hypothetical protein
VPDRACPVARAPVVVADLHGRRPRSAFAMARPIRPMPRMPALRPQTAAGGGGFAGPATCPRGRGVIAPARGATAQAASSIAWSATQPSVIPGVLGMTTPRARGRREGRWSRRRPEIRDEAKVGQGGE